MRRSKKMSVTGTPAQQVHSEVLTEPAEELAPVEQSPTAQESFWRRHRFLPLFLCLPLLILYWLVPFFSKLTIGNDYPVYSIGDQMELLFSIRHGTFPLYWPRPGDGLSAAALTLGQLYHPLTWVAALVPGYWSGHALDVVTMLRLLSLGFTHYVLYLFLRRISLKVSFALILSFIAVYNLRMLDLMRYGASLENYTGYLLLLCAVGFEFLRPSRVWGFVRIAGATYLLVVGGHPQMMYLSMIGACVTIPLLPFYIGHMVKGVQPALKDPSVSNRPLKSHRQPAGRGLNSDSKSNDFRTYLKRLGRFYLVVLVAMSAGVALAMAYVLPFYFDYLHGDSMRQGLTYQFALGSYQNSYLGTFSTFMRPYLSDVHGNFGGSVLIAIAALLPLLVLVRVRIPLIIWLFWAFFALGLAYQLGSQTPIHYLFWRYVPFAASFREPGRMSIIHPFTLMLLLAWVVQLPPLRWRLPRLSNAIQPYALLAALSLLILVGYHLVPVSHLKLTDHFSPLVLKGFAARPETAHLSTIPSGMFVLVFCSALASLIFLLLHGMTGWRRSWLELGLILSVALQSAAVLRYGTWIEFRKPTPTYAELCQNRRQNYANNLYWVEQTEHSRAISMIKERSLVVRTELARLHTRYVSVGSQNEAYLGRFSHDRDTLMVENFVPEPAVTPRPDARASNRVALEFATVNRLVFKTSCVAPAFLTLTLPYAENRWQATVSSNLASSQPARVYRANIVEQAVRVPAGDSRIEFRYHSPSTIAGFLISGLTAYALVLFMLTTLKPGRRRQILMILPAILLIGFFILWYHSLYGGQGLETVYNAAFPVI